MIIKQFVMEKIESFKINHKKLVPGIYISRKDRINNEVVTTIDIRVKRPNFEDCMHPSVAHTIEHLGATYFRNLSGWKDDIIYFGPMGCLTGFYLVLAGDYEPSTSKYMKVVDMIMGMFQFVCNYKGEIPGATPVECGNYKMMDMDGAVNLAANMLVLKETFNSLMYVYPNETNSQGIATSISLHKEVLGNTHIPDMSNFIGIEHNEFSDEYDVVIEEHKNKKDISEEVVKNKNVKSSSKKRKKKVIDKISDSSQLIDSSTLKSLDRKKVRAKVKKMVIEQNVLF